MLPTRLPENFARRSAAAASEPVARGAKEETSDHGRDRTCNLLIPIVAIVVKRLAIGPRGQFTCRSALGAIRNGDPFRLVLGRYSYGFKGHLQETKDHRKGLLVGRDLLPSVLVMNCQSTILSSLGWHDMTIAFQTASITFLLPKKSRISTVAFIYAEGTWGLQQAATENTNS
jgi:hypothetical protein